MLLLRPAKRFQRFGRGHIVFGQAARTTERPLNTILAPVIIALIVEGAGIGSTLQPGLVGTYANSNTADRAMVTGLRNYLRTVGGAFGLVISGVMLSNTLRTNLSGEPFASKHLIDAVSPSTSDLDTLDISHDQKERILDRFVASNSLVRNLEMKMARKAGGKEAKEKQAEARREK
ncbi:hypothetical protein BST61_g8112 [Cercospora zeina]